MIKNHEDKDDDTIMLDLSTTVLYGWEREKSDLTVDALVRAIEQNTVFSPVPVFKFEGDYYLSYSTLTKSKDDPDWKLTDGGHNRAVAHFIARKPLLCRLVDEKPGAQRKIPIQDIVLTDDNGEYERRKRFFGGYL